MVVELFSRLFRVRRDEWPKLFQLGMLGFLMQAGMGVGFSAGDSAFLSNVGADKLPLVFMLTPLVMLVYTAIFSYLLVRFSINHMVDVTLAALIFGGVTFWALIDAGVPADWREPLYLALKLYLAVWYIGLYSLFWNYIDAHFDIQDAKRLFPLFAAFCALGTACGALAVSLLADALPLQAFFLGWALIALATAPLARFLRRRWRQIAENDADFDADSGGAIAQLGAVARAFGRSRYTMVFTLTLFVTLLLTNLAEYQYSVVLQQGRSAAELARLFGLLYTAANLFNLVTCLFVFNRLVARLGVRNVAFVQPLTYFAVFGYFFLEGGTGAAVAAFIAYHGVLTSIEYNNENLLFNAVPTQVKQPLRTMVEGMAEPLASLTAGGFLIYAAQSIDVREMSGIGVIIGAALVGVVVALRQFYPAAMAANMRHGWMNFARASQAHGAGEARDGEAVPAILASAAQITPRERRRIVADLAAIGETAVPRLIAGLRDRALPYRGRSVAARALAEISPAQFAAQMDRLVREELHNAAATLDHALLLEPHAQAHRAIALLARNRRESVGAAMDFVLELLAIGGFLPNFDLLIVSLHSTNPKVRGNAIEAIESGVDITLFRLLAPLLDPAATPVAATVAATVAAVDLRADIGVALDHALHGGDPIAATLAVDVLHARLDAAAFASRIAPVIASGMPELLRSHLLSLMGLDPGDAPRRLDVLAALAADPALGGATLDALLALAEQAEPGTAGEGATGGTAGQRAFHVPRAVLEDVAGRFTDLALVLLRSRDDRRHAA
jgi:hypothetical protein